MSHYKYVIPFTLIGLFFSCSSPADLNKNSKLVQSGSTVQTEKGGKFTFSNADNSSVAVQVLSISESRCPQDVVCIWEGNVDVGFQFADLKSIVNLCLLHIILDCKSETEVLYGNKTYTLTLLNVSPYPTTTNSNEPRVVEFNVKLKN